MSNSAARPTDGDLIDIDQRPYIEHVFHANVIATEPVPKLVPTDPAGWVNTLRKLAGPVRVTLQRPRKRRSIEANNYLFGVVYVDVLAGLRELALDAGETCPFASDEDLHYAMKYLHFGLEVVKLPGGETIEREHPSRFLNSKQFATFIDFVKSWAAARGIYVREPGEEITA